MIEKKLSNATPLDDENVVLRRSDNNFLNKTQITNCILEAPNGVATYSGNSLTLKSGLKILYCDGLNSDGTLKNSEVILDNDVTRDFSGLTTGLRYIGYNKTINEILYYNTYYVSNTQPNIDTSKSEIWYNPQKNFIYVHDANEDIWTKVTNRCVLGTMFNSSTSTEFNMYQPINLLKQSDKSIISGWGMPSNKTINLTFGASGSTYTAPANGYLRAYITSTGSASMWTFLNVSNTNNNLIGRCGNWHDVTASYYTLTAFVPMLKGQTAKITYTTAVNVTKKILTFVYAEGEI